MTIDNDEDLTALKEVGAIVRETIDEMGRAVRPGITTAELDEIGAAALARHGARSAPRLAYGFPGDTCISINDEAAHGIPGDRALTEGDLVNIDVSAERNGYWADTGASFPVGRVPEAATRLLDSTREALKRAIYTARAGRPINAIGKAVEAVAKRGGYNIVEGLNGHGVGRFIHEPPTVSNTYDRAARQKLSRGLVITIEPFLTPGNGRMVEADDGWTLKTADGALSAQFEHTIVVTKGVPLVLT